MNVLFLTQSLSLPVFHDVAQVFREQGALDRAGFYLSDRRYFQQFRSACPVIESGRDLLLKEWEIIHDSAGRRPDLERLARYEKQLNADTLWSAVVADRRLYNGPRATLVQDYRRRYGHERLLSILDLGLERMDTLFDRLRPDLVVSFICVTFGEYLAYLCARLRGVTFLNLRPTRIQNYIYAGESVLEPSEFLHRSYQTALKSGAEEPWHERAKSYLEHTRRTRAYYEGVVKPSASPPGKPASPSERVSAAGDKTARVLDRLPRLAAFLMRKAGSLRRLERSTSEGPGTLEALWLARIVRPFRAWRLNRALASQYVREADLPTLRYAFFPLHTEPEVTLNVYSKAYLNQIEAVRLFSHSLPVGMKLVVKEHPWAIGRRPVNYYRKLLQIPNVLLAYPGMESRPLLEHAALATIISGSIGFEALMLKKPVVSLGRAPFNMLPRSMIRHVQDTDRLGAEIRDLLASHEYDEPALLSYIAMVMKYSVPVDWYSRLLGRKEAYRAVTASPSLSEDEERKKQIERLADYLLHCARRMKVAGAS